MFNKTTKKLLGFGALIGAIGIGGIAVAGPHGPGGHAGRMMKDLVEKLDLDAEQQALAQEIKTKADADRELKRERHDESVEVVFSELGKKTPNANRLHDLIDDGLAAAGESMHDRLDDVLELHATLTDTQRETLVDELEEMKERREARGDERGEPGERGGRGERRGPPPQDR